MLLLSGQFKSETSTNDPKVWTKILQWEREKQIKIGHLTMLLLSGQLKSETSTNAPTV